LGIIICHLVVPLISAKQNTFNASFIILLTTFGFCIGQGACGQMLVFVQV
jgi:hypothetical protein